MRKTALAAIAIGTIVALEGINLATANYNGAILHSCITAISGLGGFILGRR
jgi:hypothetical protein